MRYLIWDFDGTLGYREGGWSGAMLDVLTSNGMADGVTTGDIRPHILSGFRWHDTNRVYCPAVAAEAWWDELIPLFSAAFVAVCRVPEERAAALARQVREHYIRANAWQLYMDSRATLEQLGASGYRHVLLSNHVPELPGILAQLGIASCFEHVVNSAETGFEKPHPQAYARVRELLPPGADATMIGDNPMADYAGAKAAGLNAILVRRFTPKVTPYFGTLSELTAYLAGVA
jgi:putative hydrolase of the HAD superfamily